MNGQPHQRRDAHLLAQPSLFDRPPVAIKTRRAAHERSKPLHGDRHQAAINHLRRCGRRGATRHELAEALGLPLQSICSIALSIRKEKLAVEHGTRPTPTGSQAAVLILAEFLIEGKL